MRKLIGALLVMVGLVVLVDRALLMVATRLVDQRIENAVAGPVDTTVKGFPFLPSALNRTLHTVNVHAGQLEMSRADLTIKDVDFTFAEVIYRGGVASAANVEGGFLVPFSEVERRAQRPEGSLSGGADGLLRIREQVNLSPGPLTGQGGRQEVLLVARPSIANATRGQVARLEPVEVHVGGRHYTTSTPGVSGVAALLTYQISLSQLPEGIRVQQVRAQQEGLWVQVSGSDTSLTDW